MKSLSFLISVGAILLILVSCRNTKTTRVSGKVDNTDSINVVATNPAIINVQDTNMNGRKTPSDSGFFIAPNHSQDKNKLDSIKAAKTKGNN